MMKRSGVALLVSSLLAWGCAGHDGSADPGLLAPPPKGQGIQIKVEPWEIPAATENIWCLYTSLPAEVGDIYFNRIEMAMSPGSHHMIMYRDAAELVGDPPNEPGFRPCGMESSRLPITGTQSEYEDAPLPPGVGGKLDAGSKIIVESHYINYFGEPINGEVYINIWFTPKETIEHYAGIYMSYLGGYSVPNGAGIGGTPETVVENTCPMPAAPAEMPDGIRVFGLSGHMHWHGTEEYGYIRESNGDETQIYYNDDWSDPNSIRFPDDQPLILNDTQSMRYTCSYFNDTGHTVSEGPSADDEMCMLNFGYYPAVNGPLNLGGVVLCYNGQLYY